MDTTSPLTDPTTGLAPRSDAPTGSSRLGKDQFVRLLLAQLSNQDPTSPADSQAFVAQLAQFAGVELLQAATGRLDGILVAQAAGNQTAAVSLVGRQALYRTDGLTLGADGGAVAVARVAANADNVTAVVVDDQGRTVRTLQLGAAPEGELGVAWDGLDDSGKPCAPGRYKVRVTAATKEGKPVDVELRARGLITGVSFENGFPELIVGGQRIKMADVVELSQIA